MFFDFTIRPDFVTFWTRAVYLTFSFRHQNLTFNSNASASFHSGGMLRDLLFRLMK